MPTFEYVISWLNNAVESLHTSRAHNYRSFPHNASVNEY